MRALSVVSTQSDCFLSGGFDGCVKLWDRRMSPSEACVLSLKTPHAVGSVLQLSASVVVAASEAELRVFDLLNSGKSRNRGDFGILGLGGKYLVRIVDVWKWTTS